MTEKERPSLPPAWCSAICRNALNEICIESCNPKGDCSGFQEKPGLRLSDMPRFPRREDLSTSEEKFTAVTVYISKIVDHLIGYEEVKSGVIYPRNLRSVSIAREVAEFTKALKTDSEAASTNQDLDSKTTSKKEQK